MRRIIPIVIGAMLGVATTLGLLYVILDRMGPFPDPLVTPPPLQTQVWATVNGEAITREMVEAEIKVSRLNVVEPLPPLAGEDLLRATEEAINQLITRRLVLQAASSQNFSLDEAFVNSRVELLFGAYSNDALDQALDQAGATRDELTWWVREIFTVEEFTTQVIMADASPEERQQVYNDWLNGQRAAADIKKYLHGESQTLPALIGQPAPNFTLTTLDGQTVSLADYAGRVVLINFWATWCSSCLTELPEYEQIYQQYRQSDFVVLGINFQEAPEQVAPYVRGLGLTFPVLLDRDGNTATRHYQVIGLPASFMIDRQGRIFYRHLGPMTGKTLQAKLAELGF